MTQFLIPLYLILTIGAIFIAMTGVLVYSLNRIYRIYHSKRHLESTFDSLKDPLAVIDNTYTIVRVNKPFTELIGKAFAGILHKRCYTILRNRTTPCDDCRLIAVLDSGAKEYVSCSPHPQQEGLSTISISTYPFSDKRGRTTQCIVEHIRDTSALEQVKAELEKQNERLHHLTRKLRQTQYDTKRELLLAREVQQSIMPRVPPVFAGLQLSFIYHPIETICGDMYDFIQLSPNRLGIFIGDVSGHSISAALVSMISKMSLYLHTKKRMTPHLLFEHLNDDLRGNIGTSHYLTCFYGVFDKRDNSFTYSRAGHPVPVVIRKNGTVVSLSAHGTVLGILNEQFIEQRILFLSKGDRCILFTDGVYEFEENVNGSVHVFGYRKFVETLEHISSLPIEEILRYIQSNYARFKHEDDYTFVVFEVTQDRLITLEEKYPGFTTEDHCSHFTATTFQEIETYYLFLEKEMGHNAFPSSDFLKVKQTIFLSTQRCFEKQESTITRPSITILHAITESGIKFCISGHPGIFSGYLDPDAGLAMNAKENAISFHIPRNIPL